MAAISKTHDVQAVWPASATEATESAGEASANGVDVVVAMGGDGMVHHVSQGLIGSQSALGIIPAGTTNVVARILGLPSRPVKAARHISRSTHIESMGTAEMILSRGTTETRHHAIFACGFGLDAEVVVRADADPYRKYRFGSIHYARTAVGVGLGSFPKRKPHVTVTDGSSQAEATSVLVQFRDIYTYFGRLPLRLGGGPPDPMTALILGRLRRHRIPQIAFDALSGRDLGAVEGVDIWQHVDSVSLEATPPIAAQADGESLGVVDAARVTWAPNSLNVIPG